MQHIIIFEFSEKNITRVSKNNPFLKLIKFLKNNKNLNMLSDLIKTIINPSSMEMKYIKSFIDNPTNFLDQCSDSVSQKFFGLAIRLFFSETFCTALTGTYLQSFDITQLSKVTQIVLHNISDHAMYCVHTNVLFVLYRSL